MKISILIILVVLMFSIVTPRAQALFGHVRAERDRREHAEQQFAQEQQTNGRLYTVIGVLSAGVTIALIVGTAIGSKTRRDADRP